MPLPLELFNLLITLDLEQPLLVSELLRRIVQLVLPPKLDLAVGQLQLRDRLVQLVDRAQLPRDDVL